MDKVHLIRKSIYTIGCTLFIFFNFSLAQNRPHIEIADSLFELKAYKPAQIWYQKCLDQALDSSDWVLTYNAFKGLRKSYYGQDSLRPWSNKLSTILTQIEGAPQDIQGKIWFWNGFVKNDLGNPAQAADAYQKALSYLTRTDLDLFSIYAYNNLSLAYSRLGDDLGAISTAKRCLNFIDSLNLEADRLKMHQTNLLNNIGRFHFYSGHLDSAKIYYKKALKIGSDSYTSYLNFSECLILEDSIVKAKDYLQRAALVRNRMHRDEYAHKAQAFHLEGLQDSSLIYQRRCLDILKESTDRRSITKELAKMAKYLSSDSQYARANEVADSAISVLYPDFLKDENFTAKLEAIKFPEVWLLEALFVKATYFDHEYQNSKNKTWADRGNQVFQKIGFLLDDLRNEQYSLDAQYRLGIQGREFFDLAVQWNYELFTESNNKDYLDQAFQWAQRSSAFVLKRAVSLKEHMIQSGVGADEVNAYMERTMQVGLPENEGDMFLSIQEYEESKRRLNEQYPTLDLNRIDVTNLSIGQVQSKLNSNQLLLKFYSNSKEIYLFSIGKERAKVQLVSRDSILDNYLTEFFLQTSTQKQDISLANREKLFLETSSHIYQKILKGVLEAPEWKNITELTIVPDGRLKKVAFGALVWKIEGGWLNSENYLFAKYGIGYLHYISQISSDVDRIDKFLKSFVGLGINYSDEFLNEVARFYEFDTTAVTSSRSFALKPLIYAAREIEDISALMQGDLFLNQEVSSSNLEHALSSYKVVHLAAHALIDEKDYTKSTLLLADWSPENQSITHKNLMSFNVNSDMVVLSACQTENGRNIAGEGTMSLARAIMRAGGKSTVGAYWNAPDKSTYQIMQLFYDHLAKGMSKVRAMQQAQLDYMNNDELSSPSTRIPFYWAAWTVYGDTSPAFSRPWWKRSSSWILLMGLVLAIAIGYSVLYRKRS